MFVKPNFTDKNKVGVIKKIHHQFKTALVSDDWHSLNLYMQLSSPRSSLHKFVFGTKENLGKPEAMQALNEFYNNFYSPSLMSLAVCSPMDINSLEKLVTKKFKAIKDKKVTLPDMSNPVPYDTNNSKRFVGMVPVHDLDEMTITWNLPYYGGAEDDE